MKGRGLPTLAATAVPVSHGSACPVSAGVIPVDEQVLEAPRHVVEFAVDQMDVAGEARRSSLIAGEFANQAVVLTQDVFQTPAKVLELRQPLRRCERLVSVPFPFRPDWFHIGPYTAPVRTPMSPGRRGEGAWM